jgi:hypothetical protein
MVLVHQIYNFCVGPKFYLHTYCARPKDDLHSVKLFFEEALNAIKFLEWLKTFGPAQNILGPVKGQGIRALFIQRMSQKNFYLC